ncbi:MULTISPECIES: EamA family transporter RarD [Acinetobacter]|uniref:EamA family transporter RarD n=1 Tax=Acinetobacter TaxID=469 RepID=UPI0018A2FC83|nr:MULTISPECIES: EamA family transporter RarD [Acinetobacter]MBF7690937.1 EamA family transporter RarD [Acinetobacter pollinis]MBF7692920.1 EamA family transporter RarD [Acinetobacter pollinis]MBF7698523.1 EamA family transporter RarD [Acinetobacter pollinis]MBF7700501.1 EamA family transporter RarD [Acinetobacter pollinis]WEV49922.1 EamA family transporter RarD [Acinetobacter sp. ESL0695]
MLKGILLSVLASSVFGILYFYSQLLHAFDGSQVFGWRVISFLPFLTLFMWLSRDLHYISEIFQRILKQPQLILGVIGTAILGGFQLWLFLWGPMHGRGMQVSLGYFLLPLVLVLIGALFYKEKLSNFQKIAVACAILGVGHEIWKVGSIAWETALVAFGYSAYFFLRKIIKTDHLGGFWLDNILALPIAIYFVSTWQGGSLGTILSSHLIFIITGLGILSAIGLGSYILASRYLPMVLFGLLSYLEPVLLALASLMIGEKISGAELFTYIPIWCAVAILVFEGVYHIYKQQRRHEDLLLKVEKLPKRLKRARKQQDKAS